MFRFIEPSSGQIQKQYWYNQWLRTRSLIVPVLNVCMLCYWLN